MVAEHGISDMTRGSVRALMAHTVAVGSMAVAVWKAKVFSSVAPALWKRERRQQGKTGKQAD